MNNSFLVVVTLALMSCAVTARADDSCVRLLGEIKHSGLFLDPLNDEAEATEAYSMLARCPAEACAVLRYDDHKPALLAAQKQDAKVFWQTDGLALWVLGHYRNAQHGPVCVLGSFSGGTAGVWVYDGLSADGRYQMPSGSSISGISDVITPAEMFATLEKLQAKAHWLPVKPAPGKR